MEQEKKEPSQKNAKFDDNININVRFNHVMPPRPAQTRTQTSAIIAAIKPLPPGLFDDFDAKTPQKNKIESKPMIDMYSIAKMPMAPPIKNKDKKDEKERGLKDNTDKDLKDRLIPLQMATSISGQMVMFKKPVSQTKTQTVKTETTQTKKTPEPSISAMNLLKYISVTVKCRRVIYEKEYLYDLVKEAENNLAGETVSEMNGKLDDVIKILSDETGKLKEKDFPSGVEQNFIEARKILLQSIEMFREGLQDVKKALEKSDTYMIDNGRDTIDNAFLEMEKYFTIRDEIKSKMI